MIGLTQSIGNGPEARIGMWNQPHHQSPSSYKRITQQAQLNKLNLDAQLNLSELLGRRLGRQSELQVCRAKKVTTVIKLTIEAGKANPAPPIGPALGSKGVNIMAFCKEYNAQTAEKKGQVIPVEILVFEDRSFSFKLKEPPTSYLILKALGLKKGASRPNEETVGYLSKAQLKEIAEQKFKEMNCFTVEAAMRCVAGTARNMGVLVKEDE